LFQFGFKFFVAEYILTLVFFNNKHTRMTWVIAVTAFIIGLSQEPAEISLLQRSPYIQKTFKDKYYRVLLTATATYFSAYNSSTQPVLIVIDNCFAIFSQFYKCL